MKAIQLYTILFLCTLLSIISCSSEEEAKPLPAVLEVSTSKIEFDKKNTSTTFEISNSGEEELSWEIFSTSDNVTLDKTSGTDGATVNVSVDISGYNPGFHVESLDVESNVGRERIIINITVPTPPVLSLPGNNDIFTIYLLPSEQVTESTFTITNLGEDDLIWEVTSSNEAVQIDQAEGTNNAEITISLNFDDFFVGKHNEKITVTSNGGEDEVEILIISNNIKGTWSGLYSWSCGEGASGEMEVTYLIDQIASDQTFTGTVQLNNATTPLFNTAFQTANEQGRMFIRFDYDEVLGSFANNYVSGYIYIDTKTMDLNTENGDSPANEESQGCTADQTPTGSVTATLSE
jgi:hypothetical protein